MPDRPPIAGSIRPAPALLAAGAAAVVYALADFWGANPEYLDRFLILAGAAYAAWHARPSLAALTPAPARVGFLPLLAGCAAFPVGWFLQAQVGPKPVVLWWLAASWLTAAAGAVLATGGWAALRRLAFPLVFILFALPVPNRVLVPLQFYLQSATTSASAWGLGLFGIPVERTGFILNLPSGDLGIAEACSGVRSVTALTAIAAFVGWWKGFGPGRGVALVGLSIPLIAAVNAVRVVVSGLLQEYAGAEYARGHWHEGLGVGMVLLGLGLIVLVAGWLTPRLAATQSGASPETPRAPLRVAAKRGATVILAASAAATVAAQFLGHGAERELVAAAPVEIIPHRLGRWEGTDLPVPDEVAEMLTPDAVVRRVYRDFGYEVHVWAIYWSSRNMVKGYHHPDVCWPNRGFKLTRREVEGIPAGGGTLPVTVREFVRGHERQLVLYWTQEGRRVWTEQDERRVQLAGDSHDWLGERLFRRETAAPPGRLVVLLGTATWGDGAAIRGQTLELAARVANELYRLCPWAAPPE
jgi:EpsI family protein